MLYSVGQLIFSVEKMIRKWTVELFKIVERYPKQGLAFYEVDDYEKK